MINALLACTQCLYSGREGRRYEARWMLRNNHVV